MKKANQKNKQTRQSYNSEFKSEALRLADSIGVAAAATQLGLVSGQLYSWRSQLSKKQNVTTEQQSMAAENAKLKRQLAEQAEELAILKKAAAYFAKHVK
jgi:transposase